MRTWRSPVRSRRSSDEDAALVGGEEHLRRRRRAGSASPSALGHHSGGAGDGDGPLDLVGPVGQRLVEPVVDAAEGGVERDGAGAGAVQRGPQDHDGPLLGGLAAQHPQPGDAHGTGLGRAARAARCRPGFQSGSRQSQCWNTPVMLRLAVRSPGAAAGDLDGEVVLRPAAQRVGDLEGVGDEVALGVAEVGPVEPHVALVEEAVEGEPRPALGRRALGVERAAVQERTVAVGEGRGGAPVARHLDVLPAARRRSRRPARRAAGPRRRGRPARCRTGRGRPWVEAAWSSGRTPGAPRRLRSPTSRSPACRTIEPATASDRGEAEVERPRLQVEDGGVLSTFGAGDGEVALEVHVPGAEEADVAGGAEHERGVALGLELGLGARLEGHGLAGAWRCRSPPTATGVSSW